MSAAIIIIAFIIGVFAWELGRMWWQQNAWKRRWRNRDPDDE
jgi:hypothetical protein